jgi:phosphoglycolate phosphatase
MHIFTDLDGVLIDTTDRSYNVYAAYLLEQGRQPLPKTEFVAAKRMKIPNSEILEKTESADLLEDFTNAWREHIETPETIVFDILFPGAKETLLKLSSRFPITLITLRKNQKILLKELSDLGIKDLFTAILIGKEEEKRHEGKVALLAPLTHPHDVMIGDSETDIRTGKALHLTTIAVSSGWRTNELLRAESPDYLVERIEDVLTLPLFT